MATCSRTTVLVLCLIVSAEPLSLSLVPALPPAPAAPAAPGNPFLVTAPVAAPAAAPSISAAADLAPVAAIAPVSAPAPVAAPQSSPVAAPESSPGPALPTLPSSSISKTASYFKPIEDGYENIVYGFGHREEYDPTSEAKCKDKCLDYLDDLDCVMAIFCESENTQPSSVSAAAPSPGIGGLPMTIKTPQSQRSSKNYHCYLFTPSESKDQTTNYELSWGDNCKYMPVNPKCSLTVDDPGWKKYMGAIMSADHELIQKYDCNSGYTRTGKSLNEVKCTKDGVITKTGGCSLTNENSVSGGSPTPVVLSSLPQLPSVGSSSSLFAGIASRPTENGETDDNNPDTVVREEDVDTGTDVIDGNGGDTVVPEEGVDTETDVIDGNGGDTVVPEEGVDTGTDVTDGNGGDTVVPEEGVDTGTDVTDGNGGDTVVPEEGVDTGTDVIDGNGVDTVVPEEGVDTGTDVIDGNGGDTVVPEEGVDTGTDVIDGNGGDTVVPEEGVDTGTDVTDGNGGDTVVPEEGVDTGTDVTDGNGGDTVVPEEGVDTGTDVIDGNGGDTVVPEEGVDTGTDVIDGNGGDTVVPEEGVDTGTDVTDGNGGDTVVPEEGVDTGTDVTDGNGGDTVVPEEGVDTGTDVIDGNGGDTVVPEEGVDTGTDVTDGNGGDTVVPEVGVDTGTDVTDGNGGDTVVPEEGVDTGTDVTDENGGDTVVPEEGVDTGTDVIDGNGGDTVVPEEGVDTGTDVTDGNGGDTVVPEEGVDTGTDVTDGNGGDTVVPEEGVDTGTDVTDGNGGDTVVPEEGVDTGTDVTDGNGGDTVVPEEGVDTGTDVTDGNGGDTVVPEEGVDTGTDVTDGNGGDTVVPEEGVDAEPVACDVNEVFIDGVCQCDMGYQSSSGICIDVDECQQHVCEQFEECTNTPGTFSCDCVEGFKQIENGACHPINCPDDFKYDSDGNVCFKVFMEPKSMESSKQTCQGFSGGRLAILNSKQKLDAVGGSLDFNGNIWLDAKESGQHTATVFDFQFYNWRRNSFEEITWGDGSRVSTELFTTQPTSEFKECTVMSTTNDNMLAEYSCDQTLPFVCEVSIKECPSTYVYDEESHFCFKFVPEKATQNIASEHCENEGSRLAITNTHAKIDSVKNEMLKASYHEGVYVGAEQLRSTEEQYEYTYYCWWYCWFPTVYTYTNYRIIEYNYWDDHSHIESSLFDVLEPNDDWFETCIEISAVLGHELNDISCYEYLAYACEIPQ